MPKNGWAFSQNPVLGVSDIPKIAPKILGSFEKPIFGRYRHPYIGWIFPHVPKWGPRIQFFFIAILIEKKVDFFFSHFCPKSKKKFNGFFSRLLIIFMAVLHDAWLETNEFIVS